MVEVFKTDVIDPRHANRIIDQIHKIFTNYSANFDLEDCDKILRVECPTGLVKSAVIIFILRTTGYNAEVLPDDVNDDQNINQRHSFR